MMNLSSEFAMRDLTAWTRGVWMSIKLNLSIVKPRFRSKVEIRGVDSKTNARHPSVEQDPCGVVVESCRRHSWIACLPGAVSSLAIATVVAKTLGGDSTWLTGPDSALVA